MPFVRGIMGTHKRIWAVLSDEQMRKIWPFSLLNDEQMSNKVEVKHQPVQKDSRFWANYKDQTTGVTTFSLK